MHQSHICSQCNQSLPFAEEYFYKAKTKAGLAKTCKSCALKIAKDKRNNQKRLSNDPPKRHPKIRRKQISRKARKFEFQSSKNYVPNTDLNLVQSGPFVAERTVVAERVRLANQSALARYAIGKIPAEDVYLKIQLQNYECMYCKDKISFHTCHIDHVYPIVKGGEHYLYNIALTCPTCNLIKRASTLRRFCQKMNFDYQSILQEIADINHRLHDLVFGNDVKATPYYNQEID